MAPSWFWRNWTDEFEEDVGEYVTPNDTKVQEAVNSINFCGSCGPEKNAMKIWNYVFNHIDYRLSKTWYKPRETLRIGSGDCEDVTFLIGSMMLAAGIEEPEIAIGYLHHNDGRKEEHTWNQVGDMVIDGTGTPSVVRDLEYEPVETWYLVMEDSNAPRQDA